jgi:hypothetical protein
MATKILLNELFHLEELSKVKIRFNIPSGDGWDPIQLFKNNDLNSLLIGQYWNYSAKKSFQLGQTTIGLIRLNESDLWLLFHIGRVTADLGVANGVGYEYEALPEFQKYFGRIVVRFKNKSQNMIRRAQSVLHDCEVAQILPDVFDNDIFPGYENVDVAWQELGRILAKDVWRTALRNQKGVYLITDSFNGKMYVGSAYGDEMILGRWNAYAKNGHGGNTALRKLKFDYIKEHFRYSILDIFKATTNDALIIDRESWWKRILQTRRFGYNAN